MTGSSRSVEINCIFAFNQDRKRHNYENRDRIDNITGKNLTLRANYHADNTMDSKCMRLKLSHFVFMRLQVLQILDCS